MSYQKKYYYSFGSINNNLYTVEIWQDITGTTLTAEEIIADETPFIITYPKVSKFETIRGSGVDFSLTSTSNMKFLDLYTSNMKEYQVRLYSGSTMLWNGYLNSEVYSEDFSYNNNYQVQFTANDGLALLDRMQYLKIDGTKYDGFTTLRNIINTLLGKIGLAWNNIYFSVSTTSDDLTIDEDETIFDKIYTYQSNYYDEDDVPMSCREVLESILKPFGVFVKIINSSVYFIDTNTYATGSYASFKKYNSMFFYDSEVVIDLDLGDVSIIGFTSSEQTLNMLPSINKQKIICSKYIDDVIVDYDFKDPKNMINSEVTFSGTSTTQHYSGWILKSYPYAKDWSLLNTSLGSYSKFVEIIGIRGNDIYEKGISIGKNILDSAYYSNTLELPRFVVSNNSYTNYNFRGEWAGNYLDDPESYIFNYYYYEPNDVVTYAGSYYICNVAHFSSDVEPPPNSYFSFTSGTILQPPDEKLYYLKIELDVYTKTSDTYNEESDFDVYKTLVNFYLKIGTKNFNGVNWVSSTTNFNLTVTDIVKNSDGISEMNSISDKWVGVNNGNNNWKTIDDLYIPFYSVNGNSVLFGFTGWSCYDKNGNNVSNQVNNIFVKDLKIIIVDDEFKKVDDSDVEITGYVNKNVKDNGEDITLYLSSNVDYQPIQKGVMLYYDTSYHFIDSFTRQGRTDTIENLLGCSIVSNYTNPTMEVICDINKTDSTFGTFTYNNHLPSKVFGVQGAIIDLTNDSINLTLQEISIDNLDIQKNY